MTRRENEEVSAVIADMEGEAISWSLTKLAEQKDLKDNYKELVKLTFIFLGGILTGGCPGPEIDVP